MSFDPFSAAISVGTKLIGGLFNRADSQRAAEVQRENSIRQAELQKEFAQSGIQWKVEDARKAGIHPLYALGANTVSYSPQTIGSSADTSLGSAIAESGQDISRAMQATQSAEGRETAYTKSVQDLTVKKMGLENELLATQIAKQRAQIGPAMPALTDSNAIAGQPATRSVTPIGTMAVTTPGHESTQDAISKEYGDEGLPQLPGQFRFARDYTKSANSAIGRWNDEQDRIRERKRAGYGVFNPWRYYNAIYGR